MNKIKKIMDDKSKHIPKITKITKIKKKSKVFNDGLPKFGKKELENERD